MVPAAKLSVFPFYNSLLHIYKNISIRIEIALKRALQMQKSPISTKKRTISGFINYGGKAD